MITNQQYQNALLHLSGPECHNWTKKIFRYLEGLNLDPVDRANGLELLAQVAEYECAHVGDQNHWRAQS